jgi:hypothetical protein
VSRLRWAPRSQCAGEPRLKLWLTVYLFEYGAEPVVSGPYDAAISACPIGLHDQGEFMRNSYRRWNVKGCTRF